MVRKSRSPATPRSWMRTALRWLTWRALGRQHLEGDVDVELLVMGAVDHAHAAHAGQGEDAVARRDHAARGQASGAAEIGARGPRVRPGGRGRERFGAHRRTAGRGPGARAPTPA